MPKRGNGQAEMTDLMRQLLAEFVQVRQILGEHGQILREHSQILREHGQILREHGSALLEIRQDIRDMKQDIRDVKAGMNQLNQNMAQVANFVGEDRARQNEKIDAIERRVGALERKAA